LLIRLQAGVSARQASAAPSTTAAGAVLDARRAARGGLFGFTPLIMASPSDGDEYDTPSIRAFPAMCAGRSHEVGPLTDEPTDLRRRQLDRLNLGPSAPERSSLSNWLKCVGPVKLYEVEAS
jgi:hypothetical protein